MPLDSLPPFLTVHQAAEVLGISRSAAYELTKLWRESGGNDGLPVVRLGRTLRVPLAAIERYAATGLELASQA